MKEFEKWLKFTQDGWVKDIGGKTWPSFGCLNTNDEAECAEMGWIAALKWALLTGSWKIVAQEIKEEIYKTDATSEKRC